MDNNIVENIYMIVAMTEESNSIGLNGDMIYHLKDDLRYFKETTLGNTIVCGRKTYLSFPKRPLPNRKNIVLSRSTTDIDGCIVLNSKEDIIEYAKNNPEETIFICGGENVYRQFMDICSKLYITIIEEDRNKKVVADTFFPDVDKDIWYMENESDYITPENAPRYRYSVFCRKNASK